MGGVGGVQQGSLGGKKQYSQNLCADGHSSFLTDSQKPHSSNT